MSGPLPDSPMVFLDKDTCTPFDKITEAGVRRRLAYIAATEALDDLPAELVYWGTWLRRLSTEALEGLVGG